MRKTIAAAALALATAAAGAQAIDLAPVPQRDDTPPLPEHWAHGAFMEIFVRAYQDSDGDGIGDLKGLVSRLDYLRDLGVTGLWLMPVTASADHDHGYWTTDYRAVERDYGTLADLDELIAQARRRGIGIVTDYVINHASAEHPMFRDALKGPSSRFHDWFVWSDEKPVGWDIWGKDPWYATSTRPWTWRGDAKDLPQPPAGTRGWYFGTFGPQTPDFNLRNADALAYHLDSLRFWLNRGLGGFRLDAVPHMIENGPKDWNDQPESRALTRRLQDLVKGYRHRWVVCEATANPQAYGDPAVCGAAFAFGYVQHFAGAAMGSEASVRELADFYRHASPTMATFVSNHDRFAGRRLWDQVGGDEARYRIAAADYLLQPGTPFIYYGEEVGQAGTALPGDGEIRSPMSWTADPRTAGFTRGTPFRPASPNAATHNARSEVHDADSILAFYRAMLKLRNGRPSIARGSFEGSFADGLVLGYHRRLGAEDTLVLVNHGTATTEVAVPGLAAGARLQPLYPSWLARPAVKGGTATVRLPALSVAVFDVRR